MDKYDLIVIGAGSAGSSCAEKANNNGLKVALIEKDVLGGTCLNDGCDPTKTALNSAKVLHHAQQSQKYGLDISDAAVDWTALQEQIKNIQEELRGGTESEAREMMRERGIDLIIGKAAFESAHQIKVDGRLLQAENIVIATGAKPDAPPIPGLVDAGYITNENVFDLPFLPESIGIIGAGPIGVEFAQLFARFGVEVQLFEPETQILPKDDPDLAAELARILEREGVKIHTQAAVTAVSASEEGKKLTVAYDSGYESEMRCQELLMAAGRTRSIDSLHLEKAGVVVQDGQIDIDTALRTNIHHIWAAGDVSNNLPFTHVAWRQGIHVAKNIINREAKPFAYEPIPWVTYTDPELAHIGQTEAELKEAGVTYRVLDQQMKKIARAVVTNQKDGRIKLFVGEDDQILGGDILAANGGELIAPIILAMQAGIPVSTLGDTVWPYPTLSVVIGKVANRKS